MANLTKFEFVPLDISEKNYLSWVVDVEMHLDAMGLGNTIVEKNEATIQNRTKAMIFLCHHLDESLKIEYLAVKDPVDLWKNLKERYNHLKLVGLPKARYDWLHLWLQDFKSISECDSAMFKITSQLKLCGEDIFDGDIPFPEVNATNFSNSGRGRGRSCGKEAFQRREILMRKNLRNPRRIMIILVFGAVLKDIGLVTLVSTPKHLVEIYQASLKKKNKSVELIFFSFFDISHFDVVDFFEDPEVKIDHLIGDGNVQNN
ncbi:hypothetical protein CDL12_15355 [Handroanthus impetiginosus]|uniref:DUF4219 domain-containing protein n=1 Tax=Handroanthus impetiginosus TaxID=429701 RepID=A0A2G9H3E3_9LAMI|nr:hypothetical protein CDL12_15355 [Handroanthus impetiginosus]